MSIFDRFSKKNGKKDKHENSPKPKEEAQKKSTAANAESKKDGKESAESAKFFLRMKNVSKAYGRNIVLSDVDLDIPINKISGIIGVSGSGKTTLLNLIIGFLDYDSGSIAINKKAFDKSKAKTDFLELRKVTGAIKSNFGFSSQTPSVYPELSVEENLRYFGIIQDVDRKTLKDNIEILLKFTQLGEHRKLLAKELSGGMLKRLDIGCAMIHRPKLLILDEPTSNLDPLSRSNIWALIKKFNGLGTTIIIASHFIDELDLLCDNVAVLHKGEIVNQGTPLQLKDLYSSADVISFETLGGDYKDIVSKLREKDRSVEFKNEFGKAVIKAKKAGSLLNDIVSAVARKNDHLLFLQLNKPSLKEVFDNLENNEKKK